jgi:uncharacterized repeat protein (TIGR01451 family)
VDERRIAWVAPNGAVARVSDPFTGTGTDSYSIPTGSDPFAQVGGWSVTTIDASGVGFANAKFVVRDPNNANVNLSVSEFGQFSTSAGNNVSYRIELTNQGPDDAHSVVLTGTVPLGTTFVSENQESGPEFECNTPPAGSGGNISCSIATLPADSKAVFTMVFSVSPTLPNGAVISNTVVFTSSTNELHQPDNSATSSTTVVSAAAACTISCPSVAPVNTSECSAVVTYGSPTTSGNCGSNPEGGGVVCSPPSGSTFPVGSTPVTCTTLTGETCSFAVIVNFSGSGGGVTIVCPSDVTVTSDAAGTALVNYPAPTATGNCLTVTCSPPSGSIFPSGTTTVTCEATDPGGSSATCEFTVTVDAGAGGCTLTCPDDITQNAVSGQCSAVVTYAAPSTSGTCGPVTCTPASGSTFQVGTTVVNCSTPNGATCDFNVTVVSGNSLSALGTAQVWVGLKNSDDVGVKFDLLAEVLRNGGVVGTGQVNDVPGGSSGFNNAVLDVITLALDASSDFCTGDVFSLRLSVRIAESSGHVSGRARLWFNDAAANSRFSATVGGESNDYFLRDGFVLATSPGPGPKKTIDVLVNRNVDGNAFKPFGTWSLTF